MRKLSTIISAAILALTLGVLPVMADGTTREVCTTSQYGETTCTKITEEVVVHEPVDAAFGDNPLLLVALMTTAGVFAYKLSVSTSKI